VDVQQIRIELRRKSWGAGAMYAGI